jgi:glycosyltransferase involved in cell wall biosynthesis
LASQIDIQSFPENFTFYVLENRPAVNPFSFIKGMLWYNRLEKKVRPDCVIATGGHGYWRPQAPLVTGFNIPHYLYPESPYFQQISFKKRWYWKIRKIVDWFFFKRVDSYLVQTDDVNKRVRKLMNTDEVYTVSNTVNSVYYNYDKYPDKLPEKETNEVRLLTLSSYYPHKNLEVINDVVPELLVKGVKNVKFVLTLPDEIFRNRFDSDTRKYIYNIGPVPVSECPSLYNEIDFMFLPTLLECFSASYAEAMVMKKPILTSDLGFAHTVCEDSAIYFNPKDAGDIATKIIELMSNNETQEKLITNEQVLLKSFNTASERAYKFLSICEETIDRKAKE